MTVTPQAAADQYRADGLLSINDMANALGCSYSFMHSYLAWGGITVEEFEHRAAVTNGRKGKVNRGFYKRSGKGPICQRCYIELVDGEDRSGRQAVECDGRLLCHACANERPANGRAQRLVKQLLTAVPIGKR